MAFAMRPHFHPPLGAHPRRAALGRPEGDRAQAVFALGAGHHLVAVLDSAHTAFEALMAVAVVQAVDVVLLWNDAEFGVPLAIAAAVVQIGLGVRLTTLLAHKRDLCRDLIIGGRERLPLAAIEVELDRFCDPRRQTRLARSLAELADIADSGRAEPGPGPPLYDVRTLRPVAQQLREIAGLLPTDRGGVRGVALVDRLITSGQSPLYRAQVEPLRQELGRARYLLAERASEHTSRSVVGSSKTKGLH